MCGVCVSVHTLLLDLKAILARVLALDKSIRSKKKGSASLQEQHTHTHSGMKC